MASIFSLTACSGKITETETETQSDVGEQYRGRICQ